MKSVFLGRAFFVVVLKRTGREVFRNQGLKFALCCYSTWYTESGGSSEKRCGIRLSHDDIMCGPSENGSGPSAIKHPIDALYSWCLT
jgi:hypothetical protein